MVIFIALMGCDSGKAVLDAEGALSGEEIVYSLSIEEPEYGAFYQEGPVPVAGRVTPFVETVLLEGEEISVNADGSFTGEVSFSKAYEIVEVSAVNGSARERVPVFAGNPPMEMWPGGMAARVLPAGLDALGKQLGSVIDSTGWLEGIGDQLPEIDNGTWGVRPVGVLSSPTEVAMAPADSGVEVDFTLNDIGIEYEFWWTSQWTSGAESLIVQFETIAIGTTADPILEQDGTLTFSLYDADLTMDNPDFIFAQNNAVLLEFLLEQGSQWLLEPIGETLLDTLLAEIGSIDLGGPFAFETDLMGTPLGIELDELFGDRDGLALELEVALGESLSSNTSYVPIPTLSDAATNAQLALAVHEGVLDQLLSEQLLGTLNQDLDLSGFAGNIIGNMVITLSGGEDAPEDADGWCLSINPGQASVVRMQEGIEPLAILYLPDMIVNIGVDTGAGCTDWLVMSLAAEVGIEITEGTKMGINFDIGEGAVLSYGAEEYVEAEVVSGFGSYLSTLVGLLGGFTEFDLAELLGGGGDPLGLGLDGLSISILDSQKIYDFYDEWPEGLFSLSINLWDLSTEEDSE